MAQPQLWQLLVNLNNSKPVCGLDQKMFSGMDQDDRKEDNEKDHDEENDNEMDD